MNLSGHPYLASMSLRSSFCTIAETDLTKLQRILNYMARVVTKSPPFTRRVPLLHSLHWLPVKYRVHLKIFLLTYNALHEGQPVYLHSPLATSLPSHSLRSNRGITECYGIASTTSYLNTDLAVASLNLATPRILEL